MDRGSPPPYLERLSSACNVWAERGLLLLGVGMALVVIVQVFCRYVLNNSLFWSEELARYLLVWLSFVGASVAYRRHMHPNIDVVYRRLPERLRLICRCSVRCVSLGFFGLMIWYGCGFAFFVRMQTTPALALPKWTVFAIIPVSGVLLALHALAFLQQDLARRGERS